MSLIKKLWRCWCRTPQVTADPSGYYELAWNVEGTSGGKCRITLHREYFRLVQNRAYGIEDE
jgi:hypothetical protein